MSIRSKFFTKWGKNLFRDNEPELALKMFDRAIKSDPQDSLAYVNKAGMLLRFGRPDEAIAILNQAIEANARNIEDVKEMKRALIESFSNIKTE